MDTGRELTTRIMPSGPEPILTGEPATAEPEAGGSYALPMTCFQRVSLFRGLPRKEMAELAGLASARRVRRGETIVGALESPGRFFVVAEGLVKVTRVAPNGREQVVRLLGPGDFFGERALFAPDPLEATAVALEPSQVCMLDLTGVRQVLQRNPEASLTMLRALAARIHELESLVERLAIHPVESRIAALLLKLARSRSAPVDGQTVTLPLAQEELAKLLGTHQETISRKLQALEAEGLIQRLGRRRIRLVDVAGLRARAGEP